MSYKSMEAQFFADSGNQEAAEAVEGVFEDLADATQLFTAQNDQNMHNTFSLFSGDQDEKAVLSEGNIFPI